MAKIWYVNSDHPDWVHKLRFKPGDRIVTFEGAVLVIDWIDTDRPDKPYAFEIRDNISEDDILKLYEEPKLVTEAHKLGPDPDGEREIRLAQRKWDDYLEGD